MKYGFVRVAAVTPSVRVADVEYNSERIAEKIGECAQKGVQIAVFPELSLSGYTCSDLFLQSVLLDACRRELQKLIMKTAACKTLCFVGLPLESDNKLYNVAAVFCAGKLLAFVPKKNIPNYGEFYEGRHFSSLCDGEERAVFWQGQKVPLSNRILFRAAEYPALTIGCELCEDLWTATPPSSALVQAGATVIVNLSASNEIVGKKEYRSLLVRSQSGRGICGYVYADCGISESTTDTVFSGHNLIAENGSLLAESALFAGENVLISEIDVEKLSNERRKVNTFSVRAEGYEILPFSVGDWTGELNRKFSSTPFIPQDESELADRSELIVAMQANALAKRLRHTGAKCAVVGISGGLDSTLALLVTARAFDLIGLDRQKIIAITMPGFGTTGRTHDNALLLIREIGATEREISVTKSVLQHFEDIGHDRTNYDVTYENAQARMRTLILMDVANKEGGLVVGTGDLSEGALGWCTYNGDHMSMYAVNSSVPKTLVKYLVSAVGKLHGGVLQTVLEDILATEISPELLPPDAQGNISQKTEDLVGPYELHDFYLYYAIRWGYSPKKICYLAQCAFDGKYSRETLVFWLKKFYSRFFSQQFKRSCMPDGVKVGSVSLSPRGDWRMPSDAQAALWLKEVESCLDED